MQTSDLDIDWLNNVFEEDDFGQSLTKLKDEFDTLIMCDKDKKASGVKLNKLYKIQKAATEDMYTFQIKPKKRKLFKFSRPKKQKNSHPGIFSFSTTNLPQSRDYLKSNNSLESDQSSSRFSFLSAFRRNSSRGSTCSSQSSMTSQLPKPVDCIEVETDDHYVVPPIKMNGEIVSNFQYLSLHNADKFTDDDDAPKPKKRKLLQQASQRISNVFSSLKRKHPRTSNLNKERKSSLQEMYERTCGSNQEDDNTNSRYVQVGYWSDQQKPNIKTSSSLQDNGLSLS